MTPDAIMAETPGNTAVENALIREVKLHLKDINKGHAAHVHEFSVEFVSSQGTFEFRMDNNSQFLNLLKQVYGERVKMPFGYFSSGGVNIKIG